MSEQIHIERIEKVSNGIDHAMYVRGVVGGKSVEGYVGMPSFQDAERKGAKEVRTQVENALRNLAEGA